MELRDSVSVEKLFEQDTLKETTTITIQINDKGDTLHVVQITERDRIRERANVRDQRVEIRVEHDTVYIAKHDSVSTTNYMNDTNSKASPFVTSVKWLVVLVCSIIVLVIIIRFTWQK